MELKFTRYVQMFHSNLNFSAVDAVVIILLSRQSQVECGLHPASRFLRKIHHNDSHIGLYMINIYMFKKCNIFFFWLETLWKFKVIPTSYLPAKKQGQGH